MMVKLPPVGQCILAGPAESQSLPSRNAMQTHQQSYPNICQWSRIFRPWFIDLYIHYMIIHACIHASIHPYIHTYMHPCIHASMHPCIHASMHACMHPSIHPSLPAYLPTYLPTSVGTYVRACMHLAQTHMHILLWFCNIYISTNIYTYIAGIILYTYSIFYIDILLRHPFFWQEIPVPEPVPDPVEDMCRSSRSQRPFSCSIDENTNGKWHLYSLTLWLFHIAMENGPFIDGSPIKIGDFPWLC